MGDVHGEFPTRRWMINNMVITSGVVGLDQSWQVGDMGIFRERDLLLVENSEDHRFIRGNHDNPELCQIHPSHLGDFGYHPGMDAFWVGGGYSIDVDNRTIGIDWWEDEELSYQKLFEDVMVQYADTKPQIVVSHECPTVAKATVLRLATPIGKGEFSSRTENALQSMFEIHKPDIWIFGHFHVKMDEEIDGTRFVCLADTRGEVHDRLLEIPELHW